MFPTSFPDKEVISTITAKMLIEVEAVRFSSGEPFKFTSGWASPVYIDCRKLISYPRVRHTLMDFAASVITRNIGFENIDYPDLKSFFYGIHDLDNDTQISKSYLRFWQVLRYSNDLFHSLKKTKKKEE